MIPCGTQMELQIPILYALLLNCVLYLYSYVFFFLLLLSFTFVHCDQRVDQEEIHVEEAVEAIYFYK